MYLTEYNDVIDAFNNVTKENYLDFFMVVKDATPISKMMVQRLIRDVDKVETSFLSIRDIRIEEDAQQKGIFTHLLSILESKNIPIMIDDIINDKLDSFLMKRGYHPLTYQKNASKIRARYLIR